MDVQRQERAAQELAQEREKVQQLQLELRQSRTLVTEVMAEARNILLSSVDGEGSDAESASDSTASLSSSDDSKPSPRDTLASQGAAGSAATFNAQPADVSSGAASGPAANTFTDTATTSQTTGGRAATGISKTADVSSQAASGRAATDDAQPTDVSGAFRYAQAARRRQAAAQRHAAEQQDARNKHADDHVSAAASSGKEAQSSQDSNGAAPRTGATPGPFYVPRSAPRSQQRCASGSAAARNGGSQAGAAEDVAGPGKRVAKEASRSKTW
jgi:hypothetical protein